MKRSSQKGLKLTTVFFAVLVLIVSALLSNQSMACDAQLIVALPELGIER